MINLNKVEMHKGQRINLTKEDGENLRVLHVGAGWDVNRYDGSADFDIDLYAFLLDDKGKCLGTDYFIAGGGERAFQKADGSFYDHDPERAVLHTGDNITGAGEGDDEAIDVELSKLNPRVAKIVFIAAIYDAAARKQKFEMIDNAFFRAVNPDTGTERRFELSEDYGEQTALVGLELYKKNDKWWMQAVGEGYVKDVLELCTEYGLAASY